MSYSQPKEAPFSHDSIELAERVSQILGREIPKRHLEDSCFRALDLCAGCGVVGFETERRLRHRLRKSRDLQTSWLRHWTFLEVQEEYREHFRINLEAFNSELDPSEQRKFSAEFVCANFRDAGAESVAFLSSFDLIVSNPPYFEQTQGRLPPDKIKAHSRFFLDASFEQFLAAVERGLKPSGQAIFLLRDLSDHGFDRESQLRHFSDKRKINWEYLEPIRGTGLVRLWK